ncbi:MAG: thioredoxin family protein [Cyclobacteriaceae bacterium]
MEILTSESLFKQSFERAISPEGYMNLLQEYSAAGKTTGPKQAEDLIHYTRLNAQRGRRIFKTWTLNQELVEKIKSIGEKQTWLLLTESWCGDAANSVPVISRLANQNPSIDLKVLLRDSNLEIMDQYLTNGGRSIPKLIVIDQGFNELFTWGPRPQQAQDLYSEWRNSENRIPYSEFHLLMQQWYNQDKGEAVQRELLKFIS